MQIQNNTTKKTVEEMDSAELTRWLCLFEAIDIVTVKANKMGLDLVKDNNWIKPLMFKTYIKETYFSMLDKVCYNRNEEPRFDIPAYTVFEANMEEIVEVVENVEEESEEVLV
jgi:hypothetical protein